VTGSLEGPYDSAGRTRFAVRPSVAADDRTVGTRARQQYRRATAGQMLADFGAEVIKLDRRVEATSLDTLVRRC
jgi:hypothetical protein